MTAYQAVLKEVGPAEPASDLLHRRLYALGIEQGLANGDWVKVQPAGDLRDWHRVSGKWLVADGVLQNQGANGPALLILPARIGPDFELRCSFESDSPVKFATMGVVFGYNERKRNGGDWKTCEAWQEGHDWHTTVFQRFTTTKDAPKGTAKLESTNHLLVQCWQGKVSFYLNGQPMAENFEHHHDDIPSRADDGPQVGFGSYYATQRNTTKIGEIELRRLTAAPLSPSAVPATSPSAPPSPSPTAGEKPASAGP